MGGEEEIVDYYSNMGYDSTEDKINVGKFLMNLAGKRVPYDRIDYKVPIPCSQQMRHFTYDEVREFNQSIYKRTYVSDKTDLDHAHADGSSYVNLVVDRVHKAG